MKTVSTGPRSRFANPYGYGKGAATMTRQYLVDHFEAWLRDSHDRYERPGRFMAPGFATSMASRKSRDLMLSRVPALAGKELVCVCHVSQPCHVETLRRLANSPAAFDALLDDLRYEREWLNHPDADLPWLPGFEQSLSINEGVTP